MSVKAQRRRLAEAVLEQIPDAATDAIERNRTLPGYEHLPPESLRGVTEAIGNFAVDAIFIADELLAPPEVDAAIAPLARVRAELGVPLEDVLRGLLFGCEQLWDLIVATADRLELPPEILREALARFLSLTNAVMASTANTYGAIAREEASFREQARAGFLQRLLAGRWAAAELPERAGQFGLSMDDRYVPYRARGNVAALIEFERDVCPAIAAAYEEDRAGLLMTAPSLETTTIQGGLGPPALLSDIHDSFAAATHALDTVAAFGLEGLHDAESLGFLSAVLVETKLGDRLSRRYIRPLRELGEGGELILETVRSYFEHGLRVEPTARALFVHPNTLRNRLIRFEEATRADLRNVEDLMGVWWSLTRERATRAEGPPSGLVQEPVQHPS